MVHTPVSALIIVEGEIEIHPCEWNFMLEPRVAYLEAAIPFKTIHLAQSLQ